MAVLKVRLVSVAFLLVLVLSVFAGSGILLARGDSRSSIAWGVECQMSESEIQATNTVCAAIAALFDDSGYDFAEDFTGEETTYPYVYDYTAYCDYYFDFATVFYKGHSLWDRMDPLAHFYLYDNDEYPIWDSNIGYCTQYNRVHDFVFLWTCGMALWQGEIYGSETIGMSASWLYRDDLIEDTHDNPDYTDHCFIGFWYMSPDFTEGTEYGDFTFADFVIKFYQYATDGYHTVDEAFDDATNYCFGSNTDFEDSWVYTGYWREFPGMGGNYFCRIRMFGDGSMTLV